MSNQFIKKQLDFIVTNVGLTDIYEIDKIRYGLEVFYGETSKIIIMVLIALLLDSNDKLVNRGVIYFGNLKGDGIYLHGDNRTGAGDGDDERISVDLDRLPSNCNKVIFALNIYDAVSRKQGFSRVKNAYIRLVNEDNGNKEICRYNLSEDGGDNTALLFAELQRTNGSWQFKAKGELLHATVKSLADMYK